MVEVRSWQDAEQYAASQMIAMGFDDVRLTASGPDQGFDVLAKAAAAQVRHYGKPVGGPVIQQLIGAWSADWTLLCFALNGYTPAACDVAETGNVTLFSYSPLGELTADNATASRVLESG